MKFLMSLTEMFNTPLHTPLYKNKHNEREILQWRLLLLLPLQAGACKQCSNSIWEKKLQRKKHYCPPYTFCYIPLFMEFVKVSAHLKKEK